MSLLTVTKATKTFGGVAALTNISLSVEAGEILGIMGPNGSGKTTLFNLVSGALAPDTGEIFFQGERIDGLPPHRLCRRGLARTFQLVRPFLGLRLRKTFLLVSGMAKTGLRDPRLAKKPASC
jgi:branched-chain amino acid transport system ATP-binding protein